MNEFHYQIAVAIARIFLGILFLMQGYDKVFKVKLPEVIDAFRSKLHQYHLPYPLIVAAAYFTSYVELTGGFLLIIGFAKYVALYALGIDLVLVAFAMGMINPLWKMDFVFPRLVLILLLLLVPAAWDMFSADYLLHAFSKN